MLETILYRLGIGCRIAAINQSQQAKSSIDYCTQYRRPSMVHSVPSKRSLHKKLPFRYDLKVLADSNLDIKSTSGEATFISHKIIWTRKLLHYLNVERSIDGHRTSYLERNRPVQNPTSSSCSSASQRPRSPRFREPGFKLVA